MANSSQRHVGRKDAGRRALTPTGTVRDIAGDKRTEEALRESEERYRDLLENATDLIQSVTPEGSFIYVNRAWRETLGYREDEIPGLSLMDIIHPDSKAHCAETFQRVMAGEDIERVEAMFVAKDGRTITVEGNINCRFKDGKPVSTRGIFRDITQHEQAERRCGSQKRGTRRCSQAPYRECSWPTWKRNSSAMPTQRCAGCSDTLKKSSCGWAWRTFTQRSP